MVQPRTSERASEKVRQPHSVHNNMHGVNLVGLYYVHAFALGRCKKGHVFFYPHKKQQGMTTAYSRCETRVELPTPVGPISICTHYSSLKETVGVVCR